MEVNKVYNENCLDTMKRMPDNFVDSVVTDPPYGISFMGKKWDYDVPKVEVWQEVLRVLKPGGYILCACGTRTQHRMTVNIEDAGFEIRDVVAWIYGSGFPKSLNIGKALDERRSKVNVGSWIQERMSILNINKKTVAIACGVTPRQIDHWVGINTPCPQDPNEERFLLLEQVLKDTPIWRDQFIPVKGDVNGQVTHQRSGGIDFAKQVGSKSTPKLEITYDIATPEAQQYEGWGTALKPAMELWTLARKPLSEKTVASNVLKWGTGGINIDGCRVETNPEVDDKRLGGNGSWQTDKGMVKNVYAGGFIGKPVESSPLGRFPANVIHDGSDEVLQGFPDSTSGEMDSISQGKNYGIYGKYNGKHVVSKASSGSAARFFYCPKADSKERQEGCYELEKKPSGMISNTSGQHITRRDGGAPQPKGNNHPTVKPIKLIQYLIRLVTPKGGISYDPFGGSGTHPIASQNEGVNWIMSEMVAEYCGIAEKRIYNNGGLFL